MAPTPKRLNHVSLPRPLPTIEINDEQFAVLEKIYGVELLPAERNEVTSLANRYLEMRVFELHAGNYSELLQQLEKVREGFRPFWEFATGLMHGKSDAGVELEALLDAQYNHFPIRIHPSDISAISRDGSRSPVVDLQDGVVIELTSSVLRAVANSLSQAIRGVGREMRKDRQSANKGVAPGVAFRMWLLGMREWAKGRHHPFGPFSASRKDGAFNEPDPKASPFCEFLYELNQMFGRIDVHRKRLPTSLEEPIESVQALAERLKRLARVANARGQ